MENLFAPDISPDISSDIGADAEQSCAGDPMENAGTESPESDSVMRNWGEEIKRRVGAARSGQTRLLDGPAVLDDVFG